jgi:hypothetical protein
VPRLDSSGLCSVLRTYLVDTVTSQHRYRLCLPSARGVTSFVENDRKLGSVTTELAARDMKAIDVTGRGQKRAT